MIIIPMAGLSSRFFKAGYDLPKYQLELPNDQTVFEWALTSFEHYFTSDKFIFIVRDFFNTPNFVQEKVEELDIKNFEIIVLESETRGQAETVAMGLSHLSEADKRNECYIFNIDSKRHEFKKPDIAANSDGYLEVFRGEGEHWSFIELNDQDQVIRTTEKVRISDLCSDGLYYFKHISTFLKLVETALEQQDFVKGELYIAPLYNRMIENDSIINYDLIQESQISFCGTPNEYETIYAQIEGGQS